MTIAKTSLPCILKYCSDVIEFVHVFTQISTFIIYTSLNQYHNFETDVHSTRKKTALKRSLGTG